MSVGLEARFRGSLLGLALGDALGARHEGSAGGVLGPDRAAARAGLLRWTDDTQMAIGLAESLLESRRVDADRLARRWADTVEDGRGYGAGARELLRRIRSGVSWREANRSVFPEGSYGNGAAMRAAPLGLLYHREPAELRRATELASSITHAHPLGLEGALIIASAVAMALRGPVDLDALSGLCAHEEYRARLARCREWLRRGATHAEVRGGLGNGVLAHESVVTAVYASCRFADDFPAMLGYVVELGGDTDTIGAMAGGIFGARSGVGALPPSLLARLEARDRIDTLGRGLCALAGG